MLIPDDESRSKSFFISKNMINIYFNYFVLYNDFNYSLSIIYLPKIDNYIELKEEI